MGTFPSMLHVQVLIRAILHFGPQYVPLAVWETLENHPHRILQLLLDVCPATYLRMPESTQKNINVVRHLLLHHGHMFPMIPKSLQSNTGLMLLAIQCSPTVHEAHLNLNLETRRNVETHPIIRSTPAHNYADWLPFIQAHQAYVRTATRSRPY
jgi:hypothetical protein